MAQNTAFKGGLKYMQNKMKMSNKYPTRIQGEMETGVKRDIV